MHPTRVEVGEEPSLEGAELVTLHKMKLVYSRVVDSEACHGLIIHQPVFLEQNIERWRDQPGIVTSLS